jgi:hypothetical protein
MASASFDRYDGEAMTRTSTFLAMLTALCVGSVTMGAQPAQNAKPAKPKGVVIRGCLTGWTLTHLDPDDATLNIPDKLRVKSLRVIRDQVTALNGHQVEVIGSLSGIPGQSRSVLVTDSDKAKLYIGGGDKNLGEDLGVDRNEPPTVYARTIKEVAEKCLAAGG